MKRILLILSILMPIISQAANRYAVVVGIGCYPDSSEWTDIHGDNDASVIAETLSRQGIDVTVLNNEQATKSAIVTTLEQLTQNLCDGDIVLVHFSCHGQQMEDDNSDENDGLDEAIIPYDASLRYTPGVYWGQNHLRDDELDIYLTEMRRRVGKSGLLIVTVDACHAASSTRIDYGDFIRGSDMIFSPSGISKKLNDSPTHTHYEDTPLVKSPELADIIIIAACKSYQNNTEIHCPNGRYYGALSYYLASVLDKYPLTDYNKWLPELKSLLRENLSKQSPVIETTLSNLAL